MDLDFKGLRIHSMAVTSDEDWYVPWIPVRSFYCPNISRTRLLAVASVLPTESTTNVINPKPVKRIICAFVFFDHNIASALHSPAP